MKNKEQNTEVQALNPLRENKKPHFPVDNKDILGEDEVIISDTFIWNSPESWYRKVITFEKQNYGAVWICEYRESHNERFDKSIMSLEPSALSDIFLHLLEK